MLSDTSKRDRDQVVTRRARKEAGDILTDSNSSENDIDQSTPKLATSSVTSVGGLSKVVPHNILMVDQLWLWYLKSPGGSGNPDTLITSFPSRVGVRKKDSGAVDDLQASVLRNQTVHSRKPVLSTTDLISRIMTVCCRTLDRHQLLKSVEFLQMFQSTIGDAVSPMNLRPRKSLY